MERIYKYVYLSAISILAICMLSGCASMHPPVIHTYDDSIENYRYFYISPTGDYTSSSSVYGNQYDVYGETSKSINPASLIGVILFKNGFIQVNEPYQRKGNNDCGL